MKTAVISDIHGNLPALIEVRKCIDEMEIDRIVCLGDLVGYGADPDECCAITRDICSSVVLGNHDAAACGKIKYTDFNPLATKAIEWTIKNILPENIEYLSSLKYMLIDHRIIYIHGALTRTFAYIFGINEIKRNVETMEKKYPGKKICFVGHTHIRMFSVDSKVIIPENNKRYVIKPENVHFINPGSVGQPRGGYSSDASFCVFDENNDTVEFFSVEYDIKEAAKRIINAGLPDQLGYRLYRGI